MKVDFEGSDFEKVSLRACASADVSFDKTRWNEGIWHEHALLDCSVVGASFLNGFYIVELILLRSVFTNLDLSGLPQEPQSVHAEETDLSGLKAPALDLSDKEKYSFVSCDFREAELEAVNFSGQDLRVCKFYKANLSKAKFGLADVRSADFSGCSANEADFSQAHGYRTKFNRSSLRGAVFFGKRSPPDIFWPERDGRTDPIVI